MRIDKPFDCKCKWSSICQKYVMGYCNQKSSFECDFKLKFDAAHFKRLWRKLFKEELPVEINEKLERLQDKKER